MIVLFDQAEGAGVAVQPELELSPVLVTDIERAKAYYVDELGFEEDADLRPGAGVRVVRLRRPGVSGPLLLAARDADR
jgi:hypothetical protein